ncbi:c-di-AMP phosphodiesterase, consists of a GGDEF-like and DHH domains [Peptoniphilus asaccharolyticus DSM 20463]|uniref:Cyclic-di-AMP phosphodiesterase n=1 Tax=Peptoniphilus asaccharolyticus DSM 20463 TaxID=573058 RepID=A0A1W1V4X4_PEPAS|nr:DHH family phosphoesterase [Peptoniphilus asaccharolyticus]MBL7576348.1 DHH family phosphoesterase [Peptoniphilus asaccharolyticus]SMB88447.1 c-di-AMP phosphodiesterase, consists of a GGDEF-like and DHH domains [Peptoniphilus asaccharolyticus DSM 20463]
MDYKFDLKDFKEFIVAVAVLSIGLLYFKPWLGILGLLILVYLIYSGSRTIEDYNQKSIEMVETISKDFDSITKHAIFSMPFPMVITDEKANVIWYNTIFLNIFEDVEIMEMNVSELIPEIDVDSLLEDTKHEDILAKLGPKSYRVYTNVVDIKKTGSDRNKLILIYFVDRTNYDVLKDKYVEEYPIVAKIEVDNYDEAMDTAPAINRPQLIAEIDYLIRGYFQSYDALVRKYDDDMYLVVMTFGALKSIKEKRFDLLDDLRELNMGNSIPMTLSIGVSSFGLTFKESVDEADTCLDLALGRGGDQAVIKVEDNYEFFGGKSKAVEKRNKVKARVLGVALKQLIDGAEDVYIMGHKNADMDAIGSAIGILRAVINRNVKGNIVLNKSNPSISNLLDRMKEEEPEIYEKIISAESAKNSISPRSLVILVDNHKPNFTESPELLDLTTQIVVIDHHRRGKEFVKNPVLTYVEPYASSTSELVTEMLTYMNDELNLTHFEADALMSGIVVDTKNFSFQTGVRTFEAASILKRAGADMIKVKNLFQDDLDTLQNRAQVVHATKVICDEVAISRLDKKAANSILIAAQAADEMLDINGVKASFVITLVDDEVHISGRSVGDFSVQLILEKLGGGGHLNMAGARLQVESLDEAENILVQAVEEYIDEQKKGENI